jgi:hypothetical protein
MSRSAIIGLGVLVLGGLALVWLLIRDDPATDGAPAERPAPTATAPTPSGGGPGPSLSGGPALEPARPKPTAADSAGMVVTDHRTRDGQNRTMEATPVDTGPTRKLPATTVRTVHSNISALAQVCGRAIPADARGTKPRLTAKVTVAITAGSMHVRSATTDAVDVTGPAAETAKQCLHDQVMGYQLPALDEEDLDSYDLELSFLVR